MSSLSLAFDILARDRASDTLEKVGDSADRSGGKLAGMAKVAGAAFAAVGVGAVAGATKAVTAFVDFQGQMNEVFTLLPGISQEAMSSMTGQVKGFSKEFGVLPEEVVPALYQSLSAGVPQDNVFAFLETAQQAAKGGVTDLTTAVDGISSVVNAYGSDVVDATKASDLMFTAVKLGKTNFEELSSSLSNVTPIASGLGVQFGDVTAALATMTAKGTPTAVATTQLRSLFVELSKAGGEAATTFEEMAGKTFQEFIAEGGNTAEALALMQKAADDGGVALQDMFGSVEAGAAALSLSGSDSFTNNIDAMAESAGATETAFNQMNKGLGPIFDKIRAGLAVFFIDVGERLAPVVEKALAIVGQLFGILFKGDFSGGPFSEDSKVVDVFFNIREAAVDLIAEVRWLASLFMDAVRGMDMWTEGATGAERAAMALGTFVRGLAEVFRERIIPAFIDAAGFITGTLLPGIIRLGKWVIENRPVLIGLATAVGVTLAGAFAAWAVSAGAAAIATIAAAAPVILVGAAVAGLTAAIVWAYQEWDVFRSAVDAVAGFLTDTVWPAIKVGADFFVRTLIPTIGDVIRWFWNFHAAVFSVVGQVIGKVASLARAIGEKVGQIVGFFGGLIGGAVNIVFAVARVVGDITTYFRNLKRDIGELAGRLWDPLSRTFKAVLNTIIRAWNRLDFGIDVRVPGWVPGIGGKGFQVDDIFPDIPTLHEGGTVTRFGIKPLNTDEVLARLRVDETVLPAGFDAGGARAGATYNVTVNAPAEALRRPSDLTRELASLDFLIHGVPAAAV